MSAAMQWTPRETWRFCSPVYPSETILTDLLVNKNIISFPCRRRERDITVINNGKCRLAG